jgi:hypothetical protein
MNTNLTQSSNRDQHHASQRNLPAMLVDRVDIVCHALVADKLGEKANHDKPWCFT